MKISCHCGTTIFDQTDGLPHKAHVVPDQEWFGLYDAIDDEVITPLAGGTLELEAAAMKVRQLLAGASRLAWQCANCGRLYIDDQHYRLQCYVPADEEISTHLLRSRDDGVD